MAIEELQNFKLDKNHTFLVNSVDDLDRLANVPDAYSQPETKPFEAQVSQVHVSCYIPIGCADKRSAGAIYSVCYLLIAESKHHTVTFEKCAFLMCVVHMNGSSQHCLELLKLGFIFHAKFLCLVVSSCSKRPLFRSLNPTI